MNKADLLNSGIDYEAGVKRFMNDHELYEGMLTAFLFDDTFSKVSEAYKAHDYVALFAQSHTLKGVSGNLDMTVLYHMASELTEYLRNNGAPEESVVTALFDKLQSAYYQVTGGIRSAGE